ncbi:MAG: thermonuclease family protein [Methanobacterium sp.]|uniref:thermonuclease family protein n=1 Tax=Methanobacterium sp. TaxID=2164 RepID=UPI003D64B672|nr:thermonuclease family protein [Methanobacterium sp.]
MRGQNWKWIQSILVLILIISITGISGCLSENNSDSNYNQSKTSPSGLNGTSTPSSNIHYEASGYCNYVVDGDTINIEGIGRIRLSGVNTPERDEAGYQGAKDFVTSLCLGKTVGLDIDDAKHYDKYGRTLAVVYAGDTNVNAELLKRGYAEIMYILPSEFDPYSWK